MMAKNQSKKLTPFDKMISNYPLALKPRRAKYEAERARFHRWLLPRGHPYYHVHPLIPYLPAFIISRITSLIIR